MKRGYGSERFILSVTALLLLLMTVALPAGAEQVDGVVVANLRANAKLHAPDDILADFTNGKTETAVIVLLQPTAAAQALADHSRMSAEVPADFKASGAPAYYNLRDESVKAQLRATVTDTVGRAIGRLAASGMMVHQRFSYQFGFAAKVTPEALQRIVNSPDVLAVEKDAVLEPHLAQGIPLMNATAVRSTYTGAGVSIAICDTGIDTSHPRLGGGGFPNAKVIGGYDTGDNDADPRPDSVNPATHGTNCAGIAAGDLGTSGDYIGGVAPGAKLYSIKISSGTNQTASSAAMIAGWEWAVTHQNDDPNNPIMIISTSFGGSPFTSACDSASTSMTTAAANAVAAGIAIFASSGNDGYCGSIAWPACISYVNSVGAVYDAGFGTYYPCINAASCAVSKTATAGCGTGYYATDNSAPDMVTSYSNSASFLTIFAPSNQAYTTTIVGMGDDATGNYDTTFGGTSAACPYAAGSAALLQQAARAKTGSYLTPAQVRSYLVSNGDNVTDSKVAVTKPRINLGKAVNALPSAPGFTIAASPTSVMIAPGGTATTTITTTASGGFNNALSLSATGLPTGVTAAFSPTSIVAPGSGSSAVTLTATAAAPAGSYTVTVTGTGGGVTHTTTFTLTVTNGSTGSGSITTTFAGTTTQSGNMFDVTAVSGALTITKFDLNLADAAGTVSIPVNVYYKSGTYVGSEATSSAWTLLNSYTVTSAGLGNATPMPVDSLTIPAGQVYGLYITRTDGNYLTYTSGANTYSDANSKVTLGAGLAYPFGTLYTPRTWNGTIYYTTGTAPTTLLNQSFDGGVLPTGWTVTDNAGTGVKWAFNDPGSEGNQTGGAGGFAIADSYHAGNVNMDTELRTPPLNLSGYTTVTLSFRTDFYHWSSEIADVDVSSNGSAGPWTNVWHKSGGNDTDRKLIDISALAAGKSNVMIRFHYYNANWDYFWQVDDVAVVASGGGTTKPTLTVTVAGSGSGNVNSDPAGIACTTGTCTAQFTNNSSVTLMATPGATSLFSGWSGACSNASGDCVVTMSSDKAVTATFNTMPPVRIAGTTPAYYSSLEAAYTAAAEGNIIQAEAIAFIESLTLNRGIDFTLKGGFDNSFSTQSGSTTLQGLTIQNGSVTTDRVTIH